MFQRTLHYGQGEGGWNGIFQESLRPPSDAQEHEICFRFLHFLLLLLPSTGSMADKLKGSILPTTWIRERHLSFDAAINPEMLSLHLFLCVGKETIFENICEFDWYWVLWFLPVTIKEYVVKIYMVLELNIIFSAEISLRKRSKTWETELMITTCFLTNFAPILPFLLKLFRLTNKYDIYEKV